MKTSLGYAVWFALAAGLLEAALLVGHGRQIHGFIYLSPHLVWMAPVANLLWFSVGVIIVAGFGTFLPALRTPRVVLGCCIFLGALSILLIPSQLHRAAALLIAAGTGIQGSKLILARVERFDRMVHRTLPFLAGAVLLLGGGLAGWTTFQERRDVGRLTAPREGAPNIILLVLDTVRRASMSLYGYDRPTTPALERWAQRGIRFDHAITTASWTLPSHGSMMNGRLPSEMSAGWLTPIDDAHPVLAERLNAEGYRTAGFVANVLYCNRSFGLARGFTHYEDYQVSAGELLVNSSIGRTLSEIRLIRRITGHHDILGRKTGAAITDRFLAWQDANRDRPYFAFLNYFDAHQPYLPPADLATRFGPVENRNFGLLELRPYMGKIERAETALSPEQVRAEQNAYDATLAYLDQQVDRLLSELERRGELSNTIVIVTSDHGEQFMEHGLFDHGNSLYRFATEVPLLLIGRDLPAGVVVDRPVSLRDIPATVMELVGTPAHPFPGKSLQALWTTSSDPPPAVISETWGPGPARTFKGIVFQDYHAIWSADSAELYRFSADPGETLNLARSPEGATRLAELRRVLDSTLAGADPRP